ncbi:asparagine synthetase B [Adlercreutzia equolifaciens subsp. celatus]|uniref:asparagine synthase (glutamine-hydrolyzing) n=1 Tax=Adlercreutzia equolifaciens subsp. celatus DSM 18785 TaxID=1121021 RepID=A0A3N0ATZ0_9ACTN|nr:asparagine synthase (glutamine-hydrolyzing) [Adlercreutzia equolifaciens]MCP2077521.1 asparagine synthase (glutamine-hydrolyzing) [Adlercreutzia equolifaciens subsp. celatus DSM 18785]RFT93391.1 asparagine synthase (glutamine-hydrolyzing) [Adlercreutzia equolifaciens subsp. celatus]RNL38108.1 asparagine synthase (glutamine-hydrolyzing) [Adlercreutzia equolifaciens subsp. celatus DSM 18785]BCS57675.1 asparagine synthetase B [Adlercreutzia equolifaciens subsp. celatus]
MCGFVGFIDENDQTYDHRAAIVAMTDAIAHRGPDSEGYFEDGRAALGFRRLAIIDLAGANQPLYNENRSLVLVFNGEIYNYRELRRQLIAAGHAFSTQGDAEVVLHGFERWGAGVLDRLRGMFAFALYDTATGELFCARDAFGIKPLYYAVEGDRILFGSEIKGLLAHPHARRSLNERRLAHWLCMEYLPDEETLFEGVRKLPAGHWLRWRNGRAERGRWFVPRFAPDAGRSLEESAEAIEAALRESVAAHAIADVDVGCFLSAGVDSSLVAREAARIMEARTFTIGWGEGRFSELEAAATFARATGLPNEGHILDAEQFFASVPAVQYAMDEPLPNPSAVPLYHLCAMAAESVKVVLSGEGADELFGGYPYYQECLAFAPYMMVPAPARRALAAAARHLPEGTHGRRFLMRGAHPLPERYIRLEYNFPWAEALDLLAPELGARCAAAPTPWELAAPLFAEIEADEITAMQTADILTWMQQDILLKADKMSMASSLELRVPFLDREVFALASTLPASQRVGRRETKIALRAAAARTLPQATAAMPKQGFATPLAQWLQEEPWHSQVREVLNSERARRFFRTDRLNALLDEHQRGPRSHMKKIWSAYCFLNWHEQYFG